jgi:hypothetical protein
MRQRLLSHLTYANVISTVCLFLLLGGGTAVALNGSNTVFSDDIVKDQVFSADVRNDTLTGGGLGGVDLKPSSVRSSEVANGSLNDEDVGQGTFVNFSGNIGSVPAHGCVERLVTGVNAQGDHLLLTPDFQTQTSRLVYSAESDGDNASMHIQVCNPADVDINDGNTNFNLLVIDAH